MRNERKGREDGGGPEARFVKIHAASIWISNESPSLSPLGFLRRLTTEVIPPASMTSLIWAVESACSLRERGGLELLEDERKREKRKEKREPRA